MFKYFSRIFAIRLVHIVMYIQEHLQKNSTLQTHPFYLLFFDKSQINECRFKISNNKNSRKNCNQIKICVKDAFVKHNAIFDSIITYI